MQKFKAWSISYTELFVIQKKEYMLIKADRKSIYYVFSHKKHMPVIAMF